MFVVLMLLCSNNLSNIENRGQIETRIMSSIEHHCTTRMPFPGKLSSIDKSSTRNAESPEF